MVYFITFQQEALLHLTGMRQLVKPCSVSNTEVKENSVKCLTQYFCMTAVLIPIIFLEFVEQVHSKMHPHFNCTFGFSYFSAYFCFQMFLYMLNCTDFALNTVLGKNFLFVWILKSNRHLFVSPSSLQLPTRCLEHNKNCGWFFIVVVLK